MPPVPRRRTAYDPAVIEEPPRTLARAQTPRGDLALRVRESPNGPVHELIVAGIFAMDDVDHSTEDVLAEAALSRCGTPARVLVGGLGLGHTALAVLHDRRVAELEIVELEEPLVAWAHAGLVPTLAAVAADPRVRLRIADIAAVLTEPGPAYDVVLLDVDNGPSFLVHQANAGLYAEAHLRAAIDRLAPGGVLAIWAAQREPELFARLQEITGAQDSIAELVLPITREGRSFDYAIYLVERSGT